MRVLVIGGTQFMGPHVVRGLEAAGHEVTLLHRGLHERAPGTTRHIHGDRGEPAVVGGAIADAGPEVVIDMVAMAERDADALVAAASGRVRRLVLASSIDVYRAYGRLHGTEPGPPEPTPLTEDSPLRERLYPYRADPPRDATDPERWRDVYDKIPVEQTILGAPGIEGVVLRLPMVYGPDDRQHRLYPYVKRMLDRREAIPIGETRAHWRTSRGYVENVADAIVLAAQAPEAAGRVFNVAEQNEEPERAWIEAVGRVAGWRGEVVSLPDGTLQEMPSPAEAVHHLDASSARIRRELGYKERIDREEALRRTVAWESGNPPAGWPSSSFDYDAEDRALGHRQ